MTDTHGTALLIGASGLVGSHCLELLRTAPHYTRIRVLTRRDLGHTVADARIEQVIVDFADLDASADVWRVDHVFCALGTTIKKAGSQARFRAVDFGYPHTIARHARAGGARHFSLVSSIGADPRSRFFYSRVKGELEAALQDAGWPSLAILRPSLIAGNRSESRPMERIAEHALRFAPQSIRPVHARTIAAAMVAIAGREPAGITVVESRDIPRHADRGPEEGRA
jgi:uncharacterized protein YbjT (DUF2867 family)